MSTQKMKKMSGLSLRDTGIAVLIALIWGMGFVVAKGAMTHFPQVLLMALRFFNTALALVWFAGPIGTNFIRLVCISVVGAFLQHALTFTGVKGLGAGLSALVVQFEVPFLIILGALLLGERPSVWKWLGILVAFVGVAIIASQERFTGTILPVFLVMSGALLCNHPVCSALRICGKSGLAITRSGFGLISQALSQTFELPDGHPLLQNTSRETSMRVERNGD